MKKRYRRAVSGEELQCGTVHGAVRYMVQCGPACHVVVHGVGVGADAGVC